MDRFPLTLRRTADLSVIKTQILGGQEVREETDQGKLSWQMVRKGA